MCNKVDFAIEEVYDYYEKKGHCMGLGKHLIDLYGSPAAAEALIITEGDFDYTCEKWYASIKATVLFRAMCRLRTKKYAVHETTSLHIADRLISEVCTVDLVKLLDPLMGHFGDMFGFLKTAASRRGGISQ